MMTTESELPPLKSRQKEREILKPAGLSVFEKYFEGNSEAYGNLQNSYIVLGYPVINYFIGNA